MMKNPKAIAIASTALFVGSLFWLMSVKRVNSSLETGLQKEKLTSESLLSEKLLLERDLQKMKDQLLSLKENNLDLDKLVKSTTQKLEKQESEYNRMKRENISLAQIKKQRQELIAMQSQLENEIQNLKASYSDLEAKNAELNNAVASLQGRNIDLTDALNRAMFAAIDQSQIQAVKGKNETLTVRAKRTKKLIAAFEVPVSLKSLSFRVRDSKGNALLANDGTIATNISPSESNYTASSASGVQGNNLQKLELIYTPKKKLQTGLYTVEILNEGLYVGSLKVKLK